MTVKRCMAQHNQACYLFFSHVWLKTCHMLVTLPMPHCSCAHRAVVVIGLVCIAYLGGCRHEDVSAEAKALSYEGASAIVYACAQTHCC